MLNAGKLLPGQLLVPFHPQALCGILAIGGPDVFNFIVGNNFAVVDDDGPAAHGLYFLHDMCGQQYGGITADLFD